MVRRFLIGGLMFLALTVCLRADEKTANAPKAAPHAGLERMKKLAGTWVEADKEGKPTDKVVSVIKVIGGGSVVHETLFPGQPHEMISVYLLEDGELTMTHYCVLGNQPKMKADPKSPTNKIRFAFVGGTNLDPAKDKHMHEGTITFIDEDHIQIGGVAWDGGKPCGDCGGAKQLVRKK